jgi:hypothetical protein
MTKLNITNKTLYKLKKRKNQSKKKMPKKRKNRRRQGRRGGRSFRKRRRYNIKNNSMKKYRKQKGGAPTALEAGQKAKELVKSKYKSGMITTIKDDNDIQKFIILPNVGYLANEGPYANASPVIQGTEKSFQNYFLNKQITKDGSPQDLLKMINQRLTRHIYQIIKTDGLDNIYDSDEKKMLALQAIGAKMKEIFEEQNPPMLRNSLDEKIKTLSFLNWILDLTKNYDGVDREKDIKATIDADQLNTLFYLYVEGYNPVAGLLQQQGTINAPTELTDTDTDKLTKVYAVISDPLKSLIPCPPIDGLDETISDKLSLAMTKMVNDFEHTWTPQDAEGLNDNAELDGKTAEQSTHEEELREIAEKKKEEFQKYIDKIKPDDTQSKIDTLKQTNETLKKKIEEQKGKSAERNSNIAQAEQVAAQKVADEYEGKLTDKQKEVDQEKEKVKTQQIELDNQSSEIVNLKKSINDCSADDAANKAELEGKLKSAEEKLAAKQTELETMKTKVTTAEDQKQEIENQLAGANITAAAAQKEAEQAKDAAALAKDPTKIPVESLAGEEEDEDDPMGDFDFEAEPLGKGVIKAPISPDGEVIVYLKRRWDGKFIVSTLGTGGDDGDQTNIWLANIGHGAETPAEGSEATTDATPVILADDVTGDTDTEATEATVIDVVE